MTTGISIATAAVLFRNAERTPTLSIITRYAALKLRLATRSNRRPTQSTAPLRASPADSTNIAPTVMVAGLAKPASPSSGVTIPVTTTVTASSSATTSVASFSARQEHDGGDGEPQNEGDLPRHDLSSPEASRMCNVRCGNGTLDAWRPAKPCVARS